MHPNQWQEGLFERQTLQEGRSDIETEQFPAVLVNKLVRNGLSPARGCKDLSDKVAGLDILKTAHDQPRLDLLDSIIYMSSSQPNWIQ